MGKSVTTVTQKIRMDVHFDVESKKAGHVLQKEKGLFEHLNADELLHIMYTLHSLSFF